MKLLSLAALVTVAFVAAGGTAAATKPTDLPQSYLIGPSGRLTHLHAGTTYGASQLPIALRVTPSDGSWWGAQWKSGDQYFAGGKPPNFGWVHLAHAHGATDVPRGMVTITTAYARTPSVAATVNVLRTRGRGAMYDEPAPIRLAGFTGVQFDGQITGPKNVDHIGHFFVPFSPASHAAGYFPDEYPVYGDVFRVIVLDVRGKTVVVYIENVGLDAAQFPAFLTKAEGILDSLRFPAAKGA